MADGYTTKVIMYHTARIVLCQAIRKRNTAPHVAQLWMVNKMYEELVRGLRRCSFASVADYDRQEDYCNPCAYFKSAEDITCMDMMMIDAADAIEYLNGEINRLKEYEDRWEKLYECVRESFLETLDSISWEGDPNIKVFKETEDEA